MGMFQKFRVLHYLYSLNKRNRYVAHCLDFDLVTAADSLEEAERRLDILVRLHIESFLKSNDLGALNGSAPTEFWNQYTETLRLGRTLPSSTLRIGVPQVVPMHEPYGELPIVAALAA
jgi:predicted RNase H-like HicB family nuclease